MERRCCPPPLDKEMDPLSWTYCIVSVCGQVHYEVLDIKKLLADRVFFLQSSF